MKKLEELEVGQLVKSDFLGVGTVERVIPALTKGVFAYMVLWNKVPHIDYNGGSNPCFQFRSDLEVVKL